MSIEKLVKLQTRIARSENRLQRLRKMGAPLLVIRLERDNLARLEAIERQAIAEDLQLELAAA